MILVFYKEFKTEKRYVVLVCEVFVFVRLCFDVFGFHEGDALAVGGGFFLGGVLVFHLGERIFTTLGGGHIEHTDHLLPEDDLFGDCSTAILIQGDFGFEFETARQEQGHGYADEGENFLYHFDANLGATSDGGNDGIFRSSEENGPVGSCLGRC